MKAEFQAMADLHKSKDIIAYVQVQRGISLKAVKHKSKGKMIQSEGSVR